MSLSKVVQLSNKAGKKVSFAPGLPLVRFLIDHHRSPRYSKTSRTRSTFTHGTLSLPVQFSFRQNWSFGGFCVVPEELLIYCRHWCPLAHNLRRADLARTLHFRCEVTETQRCHLRSDRKPSSRPSVLFLVSHILLVARWKSHQNPRLSFVPFPLHYSFGVWANEQTKPHPPWHLGSLSAFGGLCTHSARLGTGNNTWGGLWCQHDERTECPVLLRSWVVIIPSFIFHLFHKASLNACCARNWARCCGHKD